jgi:ornithine carbamoyltransferase
MEFFHDPNYTVEKESRIKTMMPFQINMELLKHTKAKVMHDMPIHSGYEITREVV